MNARKQHYVSQAYLEAWVTDGKLYCLRDGKVFGAPTHGVAQQRDFYRLRDLTPDDLAVIELMIQPLPERSKQNARKLVGQFASLAQLKRLIEEQQPRDPAALREFNRVADSMEEQMHSRVESSGIPYVKAMRAGDTSFFREDRNAIPFLYFLCLQHFRTKRMREAILKAQRERGMPFTFERSWNVLSHIFATSTGASLYLDRRNLRIVLLDNPTPTPLITGDQPLVNLLGNGDGTPPEKLAFYYPLSPTRAMVLTEPPHIYDAERGSMTAADVQDFNRRIREASHEQIFASSRSQLEQMANEDVGVGAR